MKASQRNVLWKAGIAALVVLGGPAWVIWDWTHPHDLDHLGRPHLADLTGVRLSGNVHNRAWLFGKPSGFAMFAKTGYDNGRNSYADEGTWVVFPLLVDDSSANGATWPIGDYLSGWDHVEPGKLKPLSEGSYRTVAGPGQVCRAISNSSRFTITFDRNDFHKATVVMEFENQDGDRMTKRWNNVRFP